jgi:hypothetical protein
MSKAMARDVEQISKIVRSIQSPFKGLQEAAAGRLNRRLDVLQLSAADLAVVVINSNEIAADEFQSQLADQKKLRRDVERDNAALREVNAAMRSYIEAKHGKDTLRQFDRPVILPEWPEFYELVRTRVFNGTLPATWKDLVATGFDVTAALLDRWRKGTVAIPAEVMQALYDLPQATDDPPEEPEPVAEPTAEPTAETTLDPDVETKAEPKPEPRPRKSTTYSSDDQVMKIAGMLFSGTKKVNIMFLLGVTKGQVDIDWREPPPQCIVVSREGPIDWFQVWEMECAISGARKWKEQALLRLGLPHNFAWTDDLNTASPEAIQEMRDHYFKNKLPPLTPELEAHLSEMLLSITPSGRPVYEGILRAGPSGVTVNALASLTGKDAHSMSSRTSELERQRLIKTLHYKGSQKVWVALYWDERPEESDAVQC